MSAKLLQVRDLRVAYDKVEAVSGVSLSVDEGKTAPMDHGAKTLNVCVMMTSGCVVQLATDLRASDSTQDFGLPPLVAALNGNSPNRDLRPPITHQA